MSQIALPLDGRFPADAVRIVIGDGNRSAVEALGMAGEWPFHAAILVAPKRAGKSLLARWFVAQGRGTAIDDADRMGENAVFHAWNRAQEDRSPLLLTAAPQWNVALPDLASRLAGSMHIVVKPPGDAMIADLIHAHAAQRRLMLGEGAAAYLIPRIERSYAVIEDVVAAIDRLSLERQSPATMSVWRDALEAVQGPEQGRLL